MSPCARQCTVNAPSGCVASPDLQCVHVGNTQHSLPVQVEGYTRCDPCLLAPACCNQHMDRMRSRTPPGGDKRNGTRAEGIEVDVYDQMFRVDTPSSELMESCLRLHVKAVQPPPPPPSAVLVGPEWFSRA